MARASILTLDSPRGGVPALARTMYDLLGRAGHTPTLVYRAVEDMAGLDRRQALRRLLTTRPVRDSSLDGMRSRSVVAYPTAARYQYHTLRLARSAIRAPIAVVVSGSSHVGLPRAITGLPYVLWVATLYGDELQARAEAGDAWAASLLRSDDWSALEAQEQFVYERASVILALSPYTRDRIASRWPHLGTRLRQVFPPIDPALFQPAGAPDHPPYLLLVARIQDRRKNVELLIRACARIRATCPYFRLVIAGDEPSSDVRALTHQLNMQDVTTFAGYVERPALVSLYQRAALLVCPSRQEGLGIAVQEAMACGLPVVSTRCGGPEALVDHHATGWLVPNGDEVALGAAITTLLDDPDRRRAMGVAARTRCLELFSTAHVEAQLRQAFEETFGRMFLTQSGV